jgi:hypothetical protein
MFRYTQGVASVSGVEALSCARMAPAAPKSAQTSNIVRRAGMSAPRDSSRIICFFERAREWLTNRAEVLQQLRRETSNHSLGQEAVRLLQVFRGP